MNMKRYFIIGGIIVVVALASTLLYTVLGNHRPVIASLLAEPEGVSPGGTCQIVCDARASGVLSYDWSATGGTIAGEGAAVTWTAPIRETSYNVTVTVTDGHGGEATGLVTISVRANHAPFIKSLTADKDWATPSSSIQLTCDASDPDEDELSYEWTPSGGAISGTGATVTWSAPGTLGAYNVTVLVEDRHGGQTTAFVPLNVNSGSPPTVEKLVVIPVEHTFLRKSSTPGCDFDVWKGSVSRPTKYDIQCVASGAGQLFYDWSATDGEISGQGQTITWTTPDKKSSGTLSIDVTVMVTVSDEDGNSMTKKVVFHMNSCSCGSWGLNPGEVSF